MQAERPGELNVQCALGNGMRGVPSNAPDAPGQEIFRDRAHPGLDASAEPDVPLVRGDARGLACRTRPARRSSLACSVVRVRFLNCRGLEQ
jgi:hypothetical protein